ncbi:protein FAM240B-like isoform X1 [Crotalus tigris]|uniref:protein FAM240B-like isoform X1 n=1 Tax=Crotalus tigris TaxID=88082 RepID=UPI00192F8D02|nr:protein FAM240B-like isoform X1 [Crotalus tigris]
MKPATWHKKMNNQYFRYEVLACETGELKIFWEKTIEKQTQHLKAEKDRLQKSALTKLRDEWKAMLEKRLKMIQEHEEKKEVPQ